MSHITIIKRTERWLRLRNWRRWMRARGLLRLSSRFGHMLPHRFDPGLGGWRGRLFHLLMPRNTHSQDARPTWGTVSSGVAHTRRTPIEIRQLHADHRATVTLRAAHSQVQGTGMPTRPDTPIAGRAGATHAGRTIVERTKVVGPTVLLHSPPTRLNAQRVIATTAGRALLPLSLQRPIGSSTRGDVSTQKPASSAPGRRASAHTSTVVGPPSMQLRAPGPVAPDHHGVQGQHSARQESIEIIDSSRRATRATTSQRFNGSSTAMPYGDAPAPQSTVRQPAAAPRHAARSASELRRERHASEPPGRFVESPIVQVGPMRARIRPDPPRRLETPRLTSSPLHVSSSPREEDSFSLTHADTTLQTSGASAGDSALRAPEAAVGLASARRSHSPFLPPTTQRLEPVTDGMAAGAPLPALTGSGGRTSSAVLSGTPAVLTHPARLPTMARTPIGVATQIVRAARPTLGKHPPLWRQAGPRPNAVTPGAAEALPADATAPVRRSSSAPPQWNGDAPPTLIPAPGARRTAHAGTVRGGRPAQLADRPAPAAPCASAAPTAWRDTPAFTLAPSSRAPVRQQLPVEGEPETTTARHPSRAAQAAAEEVPPALQAGQVRILADAVYGLIVDRVRRERTAGGW